MAKTAGDGRRVVHVLRKYDPREWGGTETHVVEVTRQLVQMGWGCEVHAPQGPAAPDRSLDPRVPMVRYRSFNPFLGSASKRRALLSNAGNLVTLDEPLRLARDRGIALAHLHTAGRIGGAVRTAMRFTGRPYVISVHGPLLARRAWLEAEMTQRFSGLVDLGRPFGALLGARRVLQDAARVIVFNEEERVALGELIGHRVVRLEQGVNLERLQSGCGDRARRRWPQWAGLPIVAVIGRLHPQKNQLLAVRAFARGAPSDHHLVLAGAVVDPAYRAAVEQEIAECGVASRVHVLGNLDPDEEIPDLLALAKLVMVPSLHEAFGLIVLEAWAAACPVIVGVQSGLADLAEAIGEAGLRVPTLEVEAWAAALRQCLSIPARLEAAAQAGAALVRRRFTWEAVAKRLHGIYQAVLEQRNPE
ncbi:glycosyltransferase family 4 protein [Hyalangium sp.]|uniref:glycosyltransferase family 4 protein n=1 Tax=Hyalangium sp. TaxID=2028555 RepID=UPI002D5F7419|nr:glycosyltransferase family 4 protein [Hyalangium sp.]HYI02934.1 glycosyltransferase family 4 protein [Hyalangium sp.]